ncbi:exonuclease [Pycnococcus provasolii]
MPAKAITIEERRIRRAEAYARATEARTRLTNHSLAVSRHGQVVRHLITRLHRDGFTYVVAPFEADHQMVHLVKGGHADYVLTVDSDVASMAFLSCHTPTGRRLEGRWFTYKLVKAAIRKVAL